MRHSNRLGSWISSEEKDLMRPTIPKMMVKMIELMGNMRRRVNLIRIKVMLVLEFVSTISSSSNVMSGLTLMTPTHSLLPM